MPSRFWKASGDGLLVGKSFFAPAAGAATTWGTQADWTNSNGNLTINRGATSTFWGLIHASAAKTNGTAIFTINAIGSASLTIGFDIGTEANNLGNDANGASFGWVQDGSFVFCGAVQGSVTLPSYTTGDVLKIIKTGASFAFYKGGTLQTTVDTSSGGFGASTPPSGNAYPSACSQHNTGAQITADFSGF